MTLAHTGKTIASPEVSLSDAASDVFSYIDEGLTVWNADGRMVLINQKAREILDLPEGIATIGITMVEYVTYLAERGDYGEGDPEDHVRVRMEIYQSGRTYRAERVRKPGVHYRVTSRQLPDGGFVATYADITALKSLQEKYLHDALHDSLTGLPNRTRFLGRLADAVFGVHAFDATPGRLKVTDAAPPPPVAILMIGLDRFRVVNDSLGHLAGDRLLKALGQRLAACVGERGILSRFGGDEFTILLEHTASAKDAMALSHTIHDAMNEPFKVDNYDIHSTVSIGVAYLADGYRHPEDVLREADQALGRAKHRGRGKTVFMDMSGKPKSLNLLALENDMRDALRASDFKLVYQPLVEMKSAGLYGFEALLRWPRKDGTIISPAEFIPLAESSGLIVPIGAWVVEQASEQLARWIHEDEDRASLAMSLNVSTRQFTDPGLFDHIRSVLREVGLKGSNLKIEITESVVMENPDETSEILKALRALDVQISIDDFGTGYSSLAYLSRFPIDMLKVDRTFVKDMLENQQNLELVRTVVDMGHNLGMKVVAEGIETLGQLEKLQEMKCDIGQGYYFSKPLDLDSCNHLLTGKPSWR